MVYTITSAEELKVVEEYNDIKEQIEECPEGDTKRLRNLVKRRERLWNEMLKYRGGL